MRQQVGVHADSGCSHYQDRILEDFSYEQRELEAWSAIYHVYLRPDLDLGLHGMAALLRDRHRRTVQRRLRRGVTALASRLQELERAAETAARRCQLAARLPVSTATRLFGTDVALRQAADLLQQPTGSPFVALAGPGRIGKTELALQLARYLIEVQAFDSVVWLSGAKDLPTAPDTPDMMLRAIGRQLPIKSPDRPDAVRATLKRTPCLIVIDALNEPAAAMAATQALSDATRRSRILLTGRVCWAAIPGVHSVTVSPLDQHASIALIRHEAAQRGLSDVAQASESALADLITITAGHPLAIRLAAGQLRAADLAKVTAAFAEGTGVAAQLYRDMWSEAWHRAETDAQAVVRAVIDLLQHGQPADAERVGEAGGLAGSARDDALREAVDSGMLVPGGDPQCRRYRPGMFLRRYLLAGE